jgi:hypothetical protein
MLALNLKHPYWTMKPSEVWASDEQFKHYDKNNFCLNLRSLKKTIESNIKCIDFDDMASVSHNINYPPSKVNNRGNVNMQRHPSKKLLELDVAAGKANGTKPAELKKTRPEYKDFGSIQWCKAVNKGKSKQVEDKFWIDKLYREGGRCHAEQRTAQLKEDDMVIHKKS